jgi:hypothetical protein
MGLFREGSYLIGRHNDIPYVCNVERLKHLSQNCLVSACFVSCASNGSILLWDAASCKIKSGQIVRAKGHCCERTGTAIQRDNYGGAGIVSSPIYQPKSIMMKG